MSKQAYWTTSELTPVPIKTRQQRESQRNHGLTVPENVYLKRQVDEAVRISTRRQGHNNYGRYTSTNDRQTLYQV